MFDRLVLFVEPLCLYASIRSKTQARLEESRLNSFAKYIISTA